MIYRVSHVTKLDYAAAVANARFNLRLIPKLWHGHALHDHALVITPQPSTRSDHAGPYWVITTQIGFTSPLEKLEIANEFTIEIPDAKRANSDVDLASMRSAALGVRDLGVLSPAPYLFASRLAVHDEAIAQWGATRMQGKAGIIAAATALMGEIHQEFTFAPGTTTSSTPPGEAFLARTGVCQDFTHVMIIALRSYGIPAAYVSGYLRTLPPPGRERLVGADAMHAWVNVWCGSTLGWIGFDPTNNCLTHEDHIPIAMGRDYADVSPIDGTFIGSSPQRMSTAVDVCAIS
ncbi:MAG: transglutaminase family protein [Erythrobacter sp.]|jgi:transglutaminase-like putative cysteine protease|nr:transglutaminase family protein [Erythrobacter sp.]